MIGFIDVEDGVGEGPSEMPPHFGRLRHTSKNSWSSAGICNEGVDCMVVALTQRLAFLHVTSQGLQELSIRLGMKHERFHKPTSLRARAMTSSPGMG